MKKSIVSTLLLCLFVIGTIHAQSVSATTEKIPIDYAIADAPAKLEIISPEYLAGDSRGFKVVVVEHVEIKGVVSSDAGIKDFRLNGAPVEFSSLGIFSAMAGLTVGDNFLKFEITDGNGLVTTKEFQVYREYIQEDDPMVTSKYYALLIGIEEYEDPAILDLDNPIDDASALYDVLTKKYTFEEQNTILLKNPTRDQIYDKLDELSSKINEHDNLLIFYAGHGYWDQESEIGYWLPSDAEEGKKRDWMRNSAVTEYVREIKSHHTLLVTDACFGGSIFKTRKAFKDASMAINKLYDLPSRKAMTSGTLTEVPDKSVFMKYLLKHLETNEEDHIASEQVFYSIKPAVLNNSPNTPQFGVMQSTGDEGGDFIFIRKK